MALSPIAQSFVRDATRSWNEGSQQPIVVTYSSGSLEFFQPSLPLTENGVVFA